MSLYCPVWMAGNSTRRNMELMTRRDSGTYQLKAVEPQLNVDESCS